MRTDPSTFYATTSHYNIGLHHSRIFRVHRAICSDKLFHIAIGKVNSRPSAEVSLKSEVLKNQLFSCYYFIATPNVSTVNGFFFTVYIFFLNIALSPFF